MCRSEVVLTVEGSNVREIDVRVPGDRLTAENGSLAEISDPIYTKKGDVTIAGEGLTTLEILRATSER